MALGNDIYLSVCLLYTCTTKYATACVHNKVYVEIFQLGTEKVGSNSMRGRANQNNGPILFIPYR